jgi:hypothetical protein
MLRVAAEAAQAEEAEDIVMSVCYTMYRRMSLSCFQIHKQELYKQDCNSIYYIKLN